MLDTFSSHGTLRVGDDEYGIHRLDALAGVGNIDRLPFSLRVLLENLLRREDGEAVSEDDIRALAGWQPGKSSEQEISFMPARVLLQDLTGVPAFVDLAAMRDAMRDLGGDPSRINPLVPADLVIDHSVQVDAYGSSEAFAINERKEMERSKERYGLLRWAQGAFSDVRVMPPDSGIVHQVNLEYLATVIFASGENGTREAYPDTLVGLDSHTTMINGLGVLGWGVGGIEAEAVMLGQPVSMLIPDVVGFKLSGRLPEGATATDLVLTITQMLRERGVVAKFVEFYGEGLSGLPLASRATIANMAPEYGATCGFFPVDDETLAYLRLTGRDDALVRLVEAYCKEQGLFRTDEMPDPLFSDTLALDLNTVEPSLAGPKRPQDRVLLSQMPQSFQEALASTDHASEADKRVPVRLNGDEFELGHGSIVIAAITSCTNTSNPEVMVGAGLLAKKALELGLKPRPWVKSSLAPGSKVVIDYLEETGLLDPLEQLGFFLVGYGCTTCIGNSGPLPDAVAQAVQDEHLVAAAVLSGNRNFEGRIHAQVRVNYLASPPLVVAYALAGRIDLDLSNDPIGEGTDGEPVYLRDLWPSQAEIQEAVQTIRSDMFHRGYASVFDGTDEWRSLPVAGGAQPVHLGLGEILVLGADFKRRIDVFNVRLLAQRIEDRLRQVLEAPCLAGAAVVDAVDVLVFQKPGHDIDAVADPDEIAALPAVGVVRVVGLEKHRRPAGGGIGMDLGNDALHPVLVVFVGAEDIEELQPRPLRRPGFVVGDHAGDPAVEQMLGPAIGV